MSYKFIWKIELNPDVSEQEFIDHWREGSTILQEYPGALGTRMHPVRDEPRSFFAVAEWESQEARDAMQADVDAGGSERGQRWQALAHKNEDFGHIISFAGVEVDAVLPAHPDQA